MATLDQTIRSGIATAKSILLAGNLLATVQHQHVTTIPPTRDEYGVAAVGAAVARQCVIEDGGKRIQQADGTIVVAASRLVFLEYVDVHEEDVITLPSGRTAPILLVDKTVLDAAGVPLLVLVYLGTQISGRVGN